MSGEKESNEQAILKGIKKLNKFLEVHEKSSLPLHSQLLFASG